MTGQVERITFSNDENGFTIAKVRIEGRSDLVTVLGNLLEPTPGTVLEMNGRWTRHRHFGEQFKVDSFSTRVPAGVNGIRLYLGSGLVKGIGPVMADRIVSLFGKDTLEVIDREPDRLREVEGVGSSRAKMISLAWKGQRQIRDVMLLLHEYGVSTGFAAKIYKKYGKEAARVVRTNPYRLAEEVHGIGFITADRIAENTGIEKGSPKRIEAAIFHLLRICSEEGHVFYPRSLLIARAAELLGVELPVVDRSIDSLVEDNRIVVEDLSDGERAVYLREFFTYERTIADRISRMVSRPVQAASMGIAADPQEIEEALGLVEKKQGIVLADQQREAVKSAFLHSLLVVTGGPGTGKTTIVNSILSLCEHFGLSFLQAAPTGRAAKRMEEATGRRAKTIHRLLGVDMKRGGFRADENHPLSCDLLVIDEMSMVDVMLFFSLLRALPEEASLVLVGDENQLPSVGAGNVLRDLIASKKTATAWLREIFRQSRESRIIVNSHRINNGELPIYEAAGEENIDFYFIRQESPEKVVATIKEMVGHRIPRRFGLDPIDQVQVLSPMNRGETGTVNLNQELQELLNPEEEGLVRGGRRLSVGDKVMQLRNNYNKAVYNGDIGRIHRIDAVEQLLFVDFEGREIDYEYGELDELTLAYAISVHKSQGSEYPGVILPLMTQHYVLLQRNLLYTAVTRAKKLLVIVGTRKALSIAVKNDKTAIRYTRLAEKIASATEGFA